MARNRRWFRFYDRMIDSPQVLELNDSEFRLVVSLWCIASQHEGTVPHGINALRKRIPLDHSDALPEMLNHLQELDLLQAQGTGWQIPRWDEHQYDYPSDQPEAVRARKAKEREKKSHENVTSESRAFHALDTERELERDSDADLERESVKVASSKRVLQPKVAAQSAAPAQTLLKKTTRENGKPPETQPDKDLQPNRVLYAITCKKLGRKPETDSERGKWNRGIKELVAAGVSGEEYERLLDRAEREWGPGCDRNPMAIAPNLSSLRVPPKAERNKAEEAARLKAQEEYRRADKAMLDELAQKYGGNLCNH